MTSDALADALKIAINSVYGLTAAKFDTLFNADVQIINTVIKHNWECDFLILDKFLSSLNRVNCWKLLRAE